jgi:small conductance mechanosensitive channel
LVRCRDWQPSFGIDFSERAKDKVKETHADRLGISIPNRKVEGEILHNYGTIRQLDLTVGVAYATQMPRVFSTIHRILNANPRVLKDPAPVVGISALGDSSIDVSVKPWVNVPD